VERGAEGTVSLTPVADPSSFGVVVTDDAGGVQAFIEKPAPGEAPTNLINAGTYVLEPSVLGRVPPGERVSMERQVFPAMAADRSLFAMPSDAYWIDAGTPAKYLEAQLDLLSGARGTAPAPSAREVWPGVWTLGEPVIDGQVRPRSLVGDAAFVRAGARVRDSVVGAGARVDDATVVGSVLLPGAVVHAGALVSGSIVGAAAVVGDGAVVSGLSVVGDGTKVEAEARLDGELHPSP
jgi:mannose-1-phosphate guanylyltransferase